MPRRFIVTVPETAENARLEDMPGGGKLPKKPRPIPIAPRARWFMQGRRAASEWPHRSKLQGIGKTADDALRLAVKLMAEARRTRKE